jgi:GNAT superfamily N-acetyltransferase
MEMTIQLVESDTDLERISGVFLELRGSFTRAGLLAQMKRQWEAGYRVAYVACDGDVLCVAGFVVTEKLAWGKHLYVDDLVTAAGRRSEGAGAAMIEWLKAYAQRMGCGELHLDSGVQRHDAHRFYRREGFDITSHHFAIRLAPN